MQSRTCTFSSSATLTPEYVRDGGQPLACYWSSWHDAYRDSDEFKAYLGCADKEDRCLGIFCVAVCDTVKGNGSVLKDSRKREAKTHLSVEWRD